MNNPCTRCGKQRVSSKTWNEVVEMYNRKTVIVHTEYVCGDPKCQKIVEAQLLAQKEKQEFLKNQKEQQKLARIKH